MPAKSEKQRNFFRYLKGVKSGNVKNPPAKIRKIANKISMDNIDDFIKEELSAQDQKEIRRIIADELAKIFFKLYTRRRAWQNQ